MILGGIAVSYMVFRWFILNNYGRGTKGNVTKVVIHSDRAGGMTSPGAKLFGVEFEFSAADRLGAPKKYVGKQLAKYHFKPNDIVAVHYWPIWPRINRIVDRAV